MFIQYRDKISVFSPACRIDLICHVSLPRKECLNSQLKSVIINCSFLTEESSCSESGVGSAILPLLVCKRDMTSHLANLGISGKRGAKIFFEITF